MGEDGEAPDEGNDQPDTGKYLTNSAPEEGRQSGMRLALVISTAAVVALAGLVGCLGYNAWQPYRAEQRNDMFLRVARQVALDMTTISHNEVEADVQRILNSSTGPFYNDFSKRKQQFIELIKRERSTSQGTIAEAGLLHVTSTSARALVALSVKLSTAETPQPKTEGFRLRIDLQRSGTGAKVSDVEYVQ